jgi:putative flippase GtrA
MQIPVYLRYVAASAAALGVDFSLFLCALALGVPPTAAAAMGYSMGIVAHWLFSSRLVFVGRVAEAPAARWQQQALFVGSALVGLAITMTIVGLGSRFGYDPRLAKIIAIGVSFQATYILRKKVVFAC